MQSFCESFPSPSRSEHGISLECHSQCSTGKVCTLTQVQECTHSPTRLLSLTCCLSPRVITELCKAPVNAASAKQRLKAAKYLAEGCLTINTFHFHPEYEWLSSRVHSRFLPLVCLSSCSVCLLIWRHTQTPNPAFYSGTCETLLADSPLVCVRLPFVFVFLQSFKVATKEPVCCTTLWRGLYLESGTSTS